MGEKTRHPTAARRGPTVTPQLPGREARPRRRAGRGDGPVPRGRTPPPTHPHPPPHTRPPPPRPASGGCGDRGGAGSEATPLHSARPGRQRRPRPPRRRAAPRSAAAPVSASSAGPGAAKQVGKIVGGDAAICSGWRGRRTEKTKNPHLTFFWLLGFGFFLWD